MSWDEKIIALPPLAVTGAYLGVTLLGGLLMQAFPIGSILSEVFFSLAILSSFGLIFGWIGALHSLVIKRLPDYQTRLAKGRGIFRSAIGWTIVWCAFGSTLLYLPAGIFSAVMAGLTFLAGFSILSAIWATTSALLAFEKSDNAFQTFIQIAFFPIGVWFLQPRLQRILSPLQPSASIA